MGKYAEWAAVRMHRRSMPKLFAQKMFRRVSQHLPRGLRWLARKANALQAGSEASWEEKARFLDPIVSCGSGDCDIKDRKRALRVVHLIGSLQPGGAERQLCNCVLGQHRLGMNVSVLLINPDIREHGHYSSILTQAGITVKVAGEQFDPLIEKTIKSQSRTDIALASIPTEFYPWSIDIFGELLLDPPDVLHSWLDHPNVWGGLGALFAKVPRIVLSTRNVNPTHFPYLASPYFHAMYRQLVRSDAVRLINNSHAGAEDYARWLGLSKDKFSVVLNGVDFSGVGRATEEMVSAFREEIHVPCEARLVVGVFRLSEEKQPLIFLEVARRLIERHEDVYVVIAGIGPYDDRMMEYIQQHGLAARVRMLGRRKDVATIFAAAYMKLLCSRQEGTPNVLLEAQWLGCPVVATRAGGAVDAVSHGITGILVDVGDIDGLAAAANRLLEDRVTRNSLAANGPKFIECYFGVDRMVQETVEVYFS